MKCNITITIDFANFILRNLRSRIQFRAQELLSRELSNRLNTKANGRDLWTPLRPTINYLTTVGISSGSVLEIDYDYQEEIHGGSVTNE